MYVNMFTSPWFYYQDSRWWFPKINAAICRLDLLVVLATLALAKAQGVLSQRRGRVFHDGASLKTHVSGNSRQASKQKIPKIDLFDPVSIYILCQNQNHSAWLAVWIAKQSPLIQEAVCSSEALGIISPKAQVTRPAKAIRTPLSKVLHHEQI